MFSPLSFTVTDEPPSVILVVPARRNCKSPEADERLVGMVNWSPFELIDSTFVPPLIAVALAPK